MSYYLGIDLGGTNIVAGVAGGDYKLLEKCRMPTIPTRPMAEIVRDMAAAAKKALAAAGLTEADVDFVGLGVPAVVNPHTGNVVFATNLGWRDADVTGEFRKHWDIPVHMANDADCAALGERVAGAGQRYDSIMMITLGTGVGVGIVIGRRLFLGCDGFGLEAGHGTLVDGGFPCACGRLGCIESYASVTALIRQTIDAMTVNRSSLMWEECGRDLNRVNGRTAFDAARKGDAAARRVVDGYVRYVGSAIASLVTIYRPQAVLVGGGVSNERENLLAPVRKIVAETIYAHDVLPVPDVLRAELGNDAGILGAALLGTQA